MSDDDLMIPGDSIMTTEEIMGGSGTFEEGGIVYSSVVGRLSIHREDLKVDVNGGSRSEGFLMGGDRVLCRVENVTGHNAHLKILRRLGETREMPAPLSCELRISDASNRYIQLMEEAVRLNDIIVGDVVRGHPSVLISILTETAGIIFARCHQCDTPLNVIDVDRIGCPECERTRDGTISSLIGKGGMDDILPW